MTSTNCITGDRLVSKTSDAYRDGYDSIFGKKSNDVIRVFPDYCSTGLWSSTGSVSLGELGINDSILEIALRCWHQIWELQICEDLLSVHGINKWLKDSQIIVDYMNKEYGDKYLFVNEVNTYEEQHVLH
jgi:hypothetical protein